MESVQQMALQLINQHQDIEALMLEVAQKDRNLESKTQTVGPDDFTVDSVYALMMGQAAATDSSAPTVVASLCARRFHKSLADAAPGALLLTKQQKAQVTVLIGVIQRLKGEGSFSRHVFTKSVTKKTTLPIELLWRLNVEGVMKYDAYITCNLQQPTVIGGFAEAVCALCHRPTDVTEQETDTSQLRTAIIADILSELVEQAYTERTQENTVTKGMKKVSSALLDSITKKLLSLNGEPPDICLYEALLAANSSLDQQVLKSYARRQISIILSHNPILKVSDALMQQTGWTYAQTPPHLRHMYMQLLLVLEAEEVLSFVQSLLEEDEVNWEAVLSFIATFLVCFPEAPTLLRDLVTSLLSKALETCDIDSLVLAFLLSRQGALEGPNIFMSYPDWFQKSFGDSSTTPANNKKSFGFLLKFLTDIVPFESAVVLKSHVLSPPAVPAKCRHLLADYVLLAKTRLQDLKEPLGQFTTYDEGQSTETKDKVALQAEQDVKKALSNFEKTGRVPASVMESSIFRKPYFISRFLTSLLQPRPLPDVPDGRMKFIEVLQRCDKIPSSMFGNYEKACQKEATHLLEGFLSDEDTMETLLLPPSEQLQQALTQLAETVISHHRDKHTKTGVAGLVSIISEKIQIVLGTEPSAAVRLDQPVVVNVEAPALTPPLAQVSDMVVQTVCQIEAGLSSFPDHQGAWLSQLLLALTRHTNVWQALLCHVWVLLTNHGPDLHLCHINGLAAILVHLMSTSLGDVRVDIANHRCAYGEALLNKLPYFDERWMEFSLRLYTTYLQHAVTSYSSVSVGPSGREEAVIPPTIIKRFQFLVPRLCPSARLSAPLLAGADGVEENCSHQVELSVSLYNSQFFQNLKATSGLTFAEWASLEIDVLPHRDSLSDWQREDYHAWVIGEEGAENEAAQTGLCVTLANTILDCDTRYEEEIVQKPSSCSCPRRLSHETASRGRSRSQLMHTLRHLVAMMSPPACATRGQSDIAKAVPWLAEVWQQRLSRTNSAEEYSISRHVEHVAFLRLSRTLYPHFYKPR